MPYITTEEVKEIRKAIRAALPEFKVSVRREHHSSVIVTLLEGPIDFGDERHVNHFHYRKHYEGQPEAIAVFDKIMGVFEAVKKPEVAFVDSDYGSVPNYYQKIQIGEWDRPYQVREKA